MPWWCTVHIREMIGCILKAQKLSLPSCFIISFQRDDTGVEFGSGGWEGRQAGIYTVNLIPRDVLGHCFHLVTFPSP